MKRVFCIETSYQNDPEPHCKRGVIYTVIREAPHKGFIVYKLLELTDEWWYHSRLFVDIIEDQKDETCFVRDYQTEKV